MIHVLWILFYAAIGLILGWIFNVLFNGTKLLWDFIAGVIGSIAAPLLCTLFACGSGIMAFSWLSFAMSIVGACLLLFIFRCVVGMHKQ